MNTMTLELDLYLNDLDLQEVDLFLQDGSKGMPEYAASCAPPKTGSLVGFTDTYSCTCGCNSCTTKEGPPVDDTTN
jgi:hypothetical protein